MTERAIGVLDLTGWCHDRDQVIGLLCGCGQQQASMVCLPGAGVFDSQPRDQQRKHGKNRDDHRQVAKPLQRRRDRHGSPEAEINEREGGKSAKDHPRRRRGHRGTGRGVISLEELGAEAAAHAKNANGRIHIRSYTPPDEYRPCRIPQSLMVRIAKLTISPVARRR